MNFIWCNENDFIIIWDHKLICIVERVLDLDQPLFSTTLFILLLDPLITMPFRNDISISKQAQLFMHGLCVRACLLCVIGFQSNKENDSRVYERDSWFNDNWGQIWCICSLCEAFYRFIEMVRYARTADAWISGPDAIPYPHAEVTA